MRFIAEEIKDTVHRHSLTPICRSQVSRSLGTEMKDQLYKSHRLNYLLTLLLPTLSLQSLIFFLWRFLFFCFTLWKETRQFTNKWYFSFFPPQQPLIPHARIETPRPIVPLWRQIHPPSTLQEWHILWIPPLSLPLSVSVHFSLLQHYPIGCIALTSNL